MIEGFPHQLKIVRLYVWSDRQPTEPDMRGKLKTEIANLYEVETESILTLWFLLVKTNNNFIGSVVDPSLPNVAVAYIMSDVQSTWFRKARELFGLTRGN